MSCVGVEAPLSARSLVSLGVSAMIRGGRPAEDTRRTLDHEGYHLLLKLDETKYTFPTIKYSAMEPRRIARTPEAVRAPCVELCTPPPGTAALPLGSHNTRGVQGGPGRENSPCCPPVGRPGPSAGMASPTASPSASLKISASAP